MFVPFYNASGEHLKLITCAFAAFSRECLTDCYGVMDKDCGTAFQTWGTFLYIMYLHVCPEMNANIVS